MIEQFDAEKWLRNKAVDRGGFILTAKTLLQCADEIAAAKARIKDLERQLEERKSTNVGWRHYEAEQAMSRKLYEALELASGVIDGTKYPAIQRAVEETLNDYEKERK